MVQDLDSLDDLSKDVSSDISKRRKEGYDVYIAELMNFLFPSHIKMAKASKTDKDIQRCHLLAESIREELKIANFIEPE